MRLQLFFLVLLWSFGSMAQVSFVNDREGVSYHQNKKFLKHTKHVNPALASSAFNELLSEVRPSQICAVDFVDALQKKLKTIKKSRFHFVLKSLRSQNEMDDVVYTILTKAWGVLETPAVLYTEDNSYLEHVAFDREERDKKVNAIAGFEVKSNTRCMEDSYKNILSELRKIDKKITDQEIEATIRLAYEERKISLLSFGRLEQLRRESAEDWRLSLKDYIQKVQTLRGQFPLRDKNEKSNFVTKKAAIGKQSHRERLYENYSFIQIALMGNVIKKLKERLDSPKVEILVYSKDDTVNEVVPLEPMERFRFAIKILRKEMHELSINSYFNGRKPSYLDIMAAAYEVGIVTSLEIDEVAGLEEIWNPKKTFWDKAQVWVRMASSVAAIVIPPPYGFIATLALVAIEATNKKKDANTNLEHSLF
jgi:hypothetical protein